jgi:hypothetical protein
MITFEYFAVSLWLSVAKPEAEVNGKNSLKTE